MAIALITGASRGIGAAIAAVLAERESARWAARVKVLEARLARVREAVGG